MGKRHVSTDWSSLRRPTLVLAVLCLFLALGVSACGTKPLIKPSGGTPQRGGTFVVTNGEPSTLDPAINWETPGWDVLHTVYETLYDYVPAPGAAGDKLEPVLAAAMPTVSDDGLTYTIPLRKGVRFAPPVSRELTASDVQYSFERMLRTPQAPGTSFYDNIVGVPDFLERRADHVSGLLVLDPYTIEIGLTRPDPTLPFTLAMEFCDVLPREWVRKWGKDTGRHPLGSGPFMLERWAPGVAITVKRNPNYRDATHVWLDKIKFEAGYGPERDLMRVERNQIDCTWLSEATWVQVKDNPQFKKGVTEAPWAAMNYVVLNTRMKPFDDVRVRQAFNWAIDRERIARIDGNSPLFQIYPPGLPGNDEKAKFYGYDPAKARQLLAEAGYPNGFATTIYAGGGEFYPRFAQAIQRDLEAVGIQAKVQIVPPQLFGDRISTPQTLPLSVTGWIMDFPDPYSWVHALFGRDMAVKGGSNYSFFVDPTLEAMVTDAQSTLDASSRLAKYAEIQAYISDLAPIVPIDSWLWATLTGPDVGGFYLHPVYCIDAAHYWHR